jgi:hypothetical protein
MSFQSRSDELMSQDWVTRHVLLSMYTPWWARVMRRRFSPDELLLGTNTGKPPRMYAAIPLPDRQLLQLTLHNFWVPRPKRQRQTVLSEYGFRTVQKL